MSIMEKELVPENGDAEECARYLERVDHERRDLGGALVYLKTVKTVPVLRKALNDAGITTQWTYNPSDDNVNMTMRVSPEWQINVVGGGAYLIDVRDPRTRYRQFYLCENAQNLVKQLKAELSQ